MSTLLVSVPATEHTQYGHPENAGRIVAIWQTLEEAGVLPDLVAVEARPATVEQLTRVHTPGLVELVWWAAGQGGGRLDADTYTTPASFELASLAAGGACVAVDEIMRGAARNGVALVRPPGHHAERDRVGGFCLFNNVAVAARQAQIAHGVKRVLIIDFDVHHGNGTQDIFYADPNVLFVSLHLYHRFFYPGTGSANEIGHGPGRGTTLNVPFQPGAGDNGYALAFEGLIYSKAKEFQPEFILVSAGFDAHWADPLASANLSLSGYAHIARFILEMAAELCQSRVLFVLEGGYHPDALAYGVLNVIYALLGRSEIVDPLGPAPNPERDVTPLLETLRQLHLLS
ncbi:MAG: histone deacetylase [Chloroflexi bacterium]|nr:histone deacetylase [Chloroflexota bacterium]MCI0578484.1 histone deacetylase [Chloroflexota bacterium]MCI0648499.1 histone deacetylase [Chloroflexota bacterium]MCI0726023.1 histone deacetylase [Chloroflexota bacterium]